MSLPVDSRSYFIVKVVKDQHSQCEGDRNHSFQEMLNNVILHGNPAVSEVLDDQAYEKGTDSKARENKRLLTRNRKTLSRHLRDDSASKRAREALAISRQQPFIL